MVILTICFISAIAYFILYAASNPTKVKTITGWLCMVICLISLGLSMANMNNHFGMTKVVIVQKSKLLPLNGKKQIKLNVKNCEFKTKSGTHKLNNNSLCETTIVKDNKNNQIITKTITWKFNNSFTKFLFSMPTYSQPTIIKNTIYLTDSWHVLN